MYFQQALDHYQQAYEIKPDFMIAEKIRNCKASAREGKMAGTAELQSVAAQPADPVVEAVAKKEKDVTETAG